MRMVDLGNHRGPIYVIDTPTSVDCTKDVRFRRSFRSLMECMIPCCCGFQQPSSSSSSAADSYSDSDSSPSSTTRSTTTATTSSSVVTGTFFGCRKGRVSFCIQDSAKSSPLLLLDFAVPTSYLAREMQHGLLRITLECDRSRSPGSGSSSLFSVPAWAMYCNGRRVGFAVRRQVSEPDAGVLRLMKSVSVGAGVLPAGEVKGGGEGEVLYMRARFERVVGSRDSESFHMINPVGSTGQELSIFFVRS